MIFKYVVEQESFCKDGVNNGERTGRWRICVSVAAATGPQNGAAQFHCRVSWAAGKSVLQISREGRGPTYPAGA